MAVELGPHQIKAIGELNNGKILKGGVGSGKSRAALAYFYLREAGGDLRINGRGDGHLPRKPLDIYIITTARKRDELDWLEEAAPFGLSSSRETSVGGIQVTVDSWNNIMAYKEVKDAFFIFDEQRLVGSGAWVKAFIKIAKQNRWIVLSATPGDSWMDYIPVFVANGWYKNRTEFVRRHVVFNNFSKFPKVDHFVETGHLAALRKRVLVEMPLERHTKRHIKHVVVNYDQALHDRVWKDRWHIYEDRPIRDVGELFRVARRLVNSDLSRYAATMELLEKHPRLIVFYNFDYELDMLRVLGTATGIRTAEWNGHNHDAVPDGDRWLYLVQYTAGAEAWNCTSTDATAYWSLTYSYKQFEQSQGRIDRMNTAYTDLFYYILRSHSPVDQGVWRSLQTKEDFNESKYARRLGVE